MSRMLEHRRSHMKKENVTKYIHEGGCDFSKGAAFANKQIFDLPRRTMFMKMISEELCAARLNNF